MNETPPFISGGSPMTTAVLDDNLWKLIEPLLPVRKRRFHHPGRKRLDDRRTLAGILFVLRTEIAWQQLPQELGYGSGMTCWRRLKEWQQASVLQALHERLLAHLRAPDASTSPGRSATLSRCGRKDQAADRKTNDCPRLRPRQPALGSRTNAFLASTVSASAHTLRANGRDPRSLPPSRLLTDLPPSPAWVILLVAIRSWARGEARIPMEATAWLTPARPAREPRTPARRCCLVRQRSSQLGFFETKPITQSGGLGSSAVC